MGNYFTHYDYPGIFEKYFKISLRTIGPEKCRSLRKLPWKFPDIVEWQVCKNHVPRG
jgi:hypothetical protein